MMKKLVNGLLILTATVLLAACEPPPAATGDINAIELSQRIDAGEAPLILDVRGENEYAADHLPGAVNVPHTEVITRLDELPADRDTEIVVHCHSGRRAANAIADLQEAGFTNIRHLDGDYIGWKESGLPLDQ